jgi:hypothetical protein
VELRRSRGRTKWPVVKKVGRDYIGNMIKPDKVSELRRSHAKPRGGLHPVTKLSADLLRCPPCHIVELMAFTDALAKFAVAGFVAAGTVRTAWERLPPEAHSYILTRAVSFGCSEIIRDLVR